MAVLSAGPVAAMACEAAGPNSHVGQVTAVDPAKGTFTIMDAETREPITFIAGTDILSGLKNAKGMVKVNYEDKGDKLNAVGVTF